MIFPTPRMYVVFRNAINKRQRDKYNEKIHKQSSRVDKKSQTSKQQQQQQQQQKQQMNQLQFKANFSSDDSNCEILLIFWKIRINRV